jgi:hypothetical protein
MIVDSSTSAAQSLRKEEEDGLLDAAKHLMSLTREQYAKRLDMLEAIGNIELDIHDKSVSGLPPYIKNVRKGNLEDAITINSYINRRT